MSHPGKKKILFSILYSLRHLIALLVMSVGIYLIKTVTAILYLPLIIQRSHFCLCAVSCGYPMIFSYVLY